MVESTDVVIIGAGPAGIMAAIEATRRNVDVLLIEEHEIVGDPNHCSGLITKKGIDNLGVTYPSSIIDNSVNSVKFYSPANHQLTIQRYKKEGELLVFQRNELDRSLFRAAEKIGVEGRLNSRIHKLIRKNGTIVGVKVKPRNEKPYEIRSKIVIDAEGSAGRFLVEAGLKPPDPHWRLPSMQYELDNVDFPQNYVDLYHGTKVAPGFFAWIIPTCGGSVRIGLSTWKYKQALTKRLLDRFLYKHPVASKKLENAVITKKRGGLVTATGPIKKSITPGFIAVGDAAGQTKATTGGGVNIGGYCGRIAGAVAALTINSNNDYNINLLTYERHWKSIFYRELKIMEYYRKTIGNINDDTLDRLFIAAINSKFGNSLKNTKDIDLHSIDLMKAALNLSMVKTGLRLSPVLLYHFFNQLF